MVLCTLKERQSYKKSLHHGIMTTRVPSNKLYGNLKKNYIQPTYKFSFEHGRKVSLAMSMPSQLTDPHIFFYPNRGTEKLS